MAGRLGSSSAGRLSGASGRGSFDANNVTDLTNLAVQSGLGSQANAIVAPQNKLSFLQRLAKGLSALNPAEAVLRSQEQGTGIGGFLKNYATTIAQGVGSAVTGNDYGTSRGFADVADKLGIHNAIAKFGVGFLGDVFLDPSTYFGGEIAKGLGVIVRGGVELSAKAIGKIAPEAETGLRMAGTALRDAVGRAFQYGYKASEGATGDVLSFMSRKEQAKLGLAASNLNRLGTGVLTENQQKELALAMVAGKRAEFTAKEAAKTTKFVGDTLVERKLSPAIESLGLHYGATPAEIARAVTMKGLSPELVPIAEAQLKRSAKLAAQSGLQNPYEVYFPFLKSDKVDTFVKQTAGLKVGSQGYLKEFRNLLTNDNIELSPAKAFFTREAQQVTDRMTGDFLKGFVAKFGRPLDVFKDSEEAAKAGFTLVKDKGIFGSPLGYVSKYDGALIHDSLLPEFQTINMLAKATGFDAVTSLFKRSVTGLFAPFHVRNYFSGIVQNFETLGVDALNPKNIAIGQKIAYLIGKGEKLPTDLLEIGGKKISFRKIMQPFVDRFSGDTFYNNDFLDALKNGESISTAEKVFSRKSVVKTLGLQKGAVIPIFNEQGLPMKVGRAVGQFIEHQQKATAYITALGQGKSIQEALKLAETAGFDYRALTRFESQIMRRIIPFYSFTRKNIELQLKTLGENPQRINQILKFFENIGVATGGGALSEEEKQNLPDYIKQSLAIKLPDTKDGLKQYITSFGTPIEQFGQLFGANKVLTAISQMNPLLKVPVEIGIGKDSFRQQDLKSVYNAYEYKNAPQVVKNLLQLQDVQKPRYKKLANGKLVATGETYTIYVANPERLLIARSLFTSRGVSYLDQAFGGNLTGFVKALKLTTGVKPTAPIDLKQLESINNIQISRDLQDLLARYGIVKQYTATYLPKK